MGEARWSVLWITRLTPLWITMLRICGLRASHLWISQHFGLGRIYPHLRCCGLVECGGWLRPHTPQAGLSPARHASCGCFSGAHGRGGEQEMQGDIAPCGTTHRDAATPLLLTHAGSPFRSPSFSVFSVFCGFFSTCSLFPCGPCFPWTLPTCSAAHSAFLSILCILWFLIPHAVLLWFLIPTCSIKTKNA